MALQLPSSLTDLHLRVPSDADELREVMNALPRSLVRLSLIVTSEQRTTFSFLLPLIPPNLIALHWRIEGHFQRPRKVFDNTELALLPRNLSVSSLIYGWNLNQTERGRAILDVNLPRLPDTAFFRVAWSPASQAAIPPFISNLELSALENDWKWIDAIKALPPHVETLGIPAGASPSKHFDSKLVRELPRRITHLQIILNLTSDLKPGDFPPLLRKLNIGFVKKAFSSSSASCFPPITTLTLYTSLKLCSINYIPRSVTSLTVLLSDAKGDVVWPPNLRRLKLHGYHGLTQFGAGPDPKKARKTNGVMQGDTRILPHPGGCILRTVSFAALPQATLTYLNVQFYPIPFSQCLFLPHSLKRLSLDYIVQDGQFDPFGESSLARARELLAMDPESADYDFHLLGSDRPHIVLFDLLPRSLTDLTLKSIKGFPPVAWSRLPPKLERLDTFEMESVHADAILHLPKSCLNSLDMHVSDFGEAHVNVLPKDAKRLTFVCESLSADLTVELVPEAPVALELKGPCTRVSAFSFAVDNRAIELDNGTVQFKILRKVLPKTRI